MVQNDAKSDQDNDKLIDLLKNINNEFDSIETFLESDSEKSERFKLYLKRLYDYLKAQDDNDYISTKSPHTNPKISQSNQSSALPELIVDKNLVDLEQIYQQLQLYNQNSDLTSSASINSLTKFFSKCLVNMDMLSFNLDLSDSLKKNSKNKSPSSNKHTGIGSSLSNDESVDAEADEEDEDQEDEYDDEQDDDADSIDNLIKFSKEKLKLKSSSKSAKKNLDTNFGIPDGSDSEISDFDVEEGEHDEEDEDEEEEVDENEPDFGEKDEEEEGGEIDSDEVDDDLVDLYQDLGDEKELLGIGKPAKGFDEVDFDREDFGLVDDDPNFKGEDQEPDEEDFEDNLKPRPNKPKDLFDVDVANEEEKQIIKKTDGMSTFEVRQEKLKETIEGIHDSMINNIAKKPWQLQGESTARARPKDSLLEEYLEFDHTTRQAPVMTASTTEQIEKLIKQRIKDKAFDDVERKVKPVDMQYAYKKQVVLDHEKSKLGLGDVYEQEFLKKQAEATQATDDKPKEQAANPKHEEIRKQLQTLFIKLDALSNFHFTPKAPVPELKVVSNMPTINMEEVAPVNVAESNSLAPEEIKAKINALPKSKSEENKSDRNRNMRAKKLLGRKKKVERENRLQMAQALDPDNVKVNKEIAMNKLKKQAKNLSKNIKILKKDNKQTGNNKALKSSSAFFKQLQENAQISKKVSKKKATDENLKSSKKLKL